MLSCYRMLLSNVVSVVVYFVGICEGGQCNVSKDWLPSVVIDMTVVIIDIDSVLASEVKERHGGDKV